MRYRQIHFPGNSARFSYNFQKSFQIWNFFPGILPVGKDCKGGVLILGSFLQSFHSLFQLRDIFTVGKASQHIPG
jgi:hypothetical protein